MAKTNKRALAMMVAVIMILCLVPIVSMAATVTVGEPVYSAATDKITVSGTTGDFSSGGQVTMLAIRANEALDTIPTNLDTEAGENSIMYIDQIDPDSTNGTFSWEFSPRGTGTGNYVTIFVGGTEVSFIGFDSVLLPTAVTDGPDVTCAETCLVGENIEISFYATNYAAWANIISIKVNGVVLGSEDFTLDKVAGTITIPTDEAILHNIVISAEGYEDVVVSVNVTLRPAGVVTLGDYSTLVCFVEGTAYDAVFTITDSSPEGWLENLVIDVVDSEGNDAGEVSVDEGTGTITFTNAVPDDKTLYALTFDAADDYAAVEDIEFYIISKAGAALSSVKAATYDADTDPNKYSITVPGDYTDDVSGLTVAYSVTVDGVDKDISTSRTFDVVRPADDGDADNVDKTPVIVTATVGEAADNKTKVQTIDVLEVGASASVITEDDIEFIQEGKAYSAYRTNATIVKISASNIDIEEVTLMIGEYEMYYSPVKDAFYGILTLENESPKNAIVGAASKQSKENGASKIFFGNASDPSIDPSLKGEEIAAWDAGVVGNIVLKAIEPTDDQLLVSDVSEAEPDGEVVAWDAATIGNIVLGAIAELPVNE